MSGVWEEKSKGEGVSEAGPSKRKCKWRVSDVLHFWEGTISSVPGKEFSDSDQYVAIVSWGVLPFYTIPGTKLNHSTIR